MTLASTNAVIVLHAFGPYTRGEILTDPAVVAAVLSGGNAAMVVRTQIQQHYSDLRLPVQEH